jgi:ERO1-like protein beta
VSGPIATHPSQLPTPLHPKAETTAPLRGALGQDAAEMCIFERNGYDSERDYCIPEDESSSAGGVYVSLVSNPERFTGYAGDHANAIWREIYRENCFELQPRDAQEEAMLGKTHIGQSGAKSDLEAVILGKNKGRASGATVTQEYNQLNLDNTCLEKRVFWRLISGMHTSISTHLCWDHLNQTTGEWVSSVLASFLISRDRISSVSSPASGNVLSGSKIYISTTSLSSVPSPNYRVT